VAADTSRNLEYSITGSAWTPATVKSYDSGSGDCVGATWETSATFSVSPTTVTAYPLYVRNADGCSATLPEAVTVTPPPTIVRPPKDKSICSDTKARLDVVARLATAYQWYEDDTEISGATATTYTTGDLAAGKTYKVTVANSACSATSSVATVTIIPNCDTGCTLPEEETTFSAFNPCLSAATGTTWYLTDEREAAYNNTQTYKVRKMPDSRIWMIQDMRFGDKCTADYDTPMNNRQGNVTSTDPLAYGDCTTKTNASTPVARGTMYSFAAAINQMNAYAGSGVSFNCGESCRGFCPEGWHLPSTGEYSALITGIGTCAEGAACWDEMSLWEGVIGGVVRGGGNIAAGEARYHTSYGSTSVTSFGTRGSGWSLIDSGDRTSARAVRCIKNRD
jgi:uncharacterized protein (TIGR02145 family)